MYLYVLTVREQNFTIRNAGFTKDYGITVIVIVTWAQFLEKILVR